MHCKLSDFWQKTRSALGLPSDNFQSSLRDFSSLEFPPRTPSWAKFSRPSGTHSAIGRFSRRLFSPYLNPAKPFGLQALRYSFQFISSAKKSPQDDRHLV